VHLKIRYTFLLLLIGCLSTLQIFAQQRKEGMTGWKGKDRGEGEHIAKLLRCLQREELMNYTQLFPTVENMSRWIIEVSPPRSSAYQKAVFYLNKPELLHIMDTSIRNARKKEFNKMLHKAENIGLHWSKTVLLNYELERMKKTRDTVLEKIAPERFLGYVFVKDQITDSVYCFTVSDLQMIKGNWYGGYLKNLFKADTKAEYELQRMMEEKFYAKLAHHKTDSVNLIIDSLDDSRNDFIVARKYYEGTLDGYIPIELYIRYIKDTCAEDVCRYEALYKFGDNEDFISLRVSKKEKEWTFREDKYNAFMQLTLGKIKYTGIWNDPAEHVKYKALLTELEELPEETKDLDAELDQAIVERMQAIANGEEPEKDVEIENTETSEKTQEQAEPKKEIKSEDAPIKDKKVEKKKKEEKKKDKPKKERKQPTLIDDGL